MGTESVAGSSSGLAAQRTGDDPGQLIGGRLEPVVDDHVAEFRLGAELPLGGAHALVDLVRIVGAAPDQARSQGVAGRGGDEHLNGRRHRRAHLPGSLDLDLQHHRRPHRQAPFELGAERPVAVTRIYGVLDEISCVDTAIEFCVGEEVISDPVLLPGLGLRVVAETESSSSGVRSSRPRISVPLPTPDGPVITNTLAKRWWAVPGRC